MKLATFSTAQGTSYGIVTGKGIVDLKRYIAHYLRIYMGHLRHKLEDNPAQPRYLVTETGVGYRFQLP